MLTEYIAPDAADAVAAFRAAGAVSHHRLTLAQARAAYDQSCAQNAVPLPEPVEHDDLVLGTGDVRVRRFRRKGGACATEPRGAVVFIHGGGWVMGSVDTHEAICGYLATATGLPVLSIDYRLAPEHPYPAAIDDCAQALDAILADDAGLGIDPARVVLVGDSAGGQLAASLARTPRPVPLAGLALIYPVTDLTMRGQSHRDVTGFPLVHDTMRWFAEQYVPAGIDRTDEWLSPGLHPIPAGHPDTFVATVENDPLRTEGVAYAERLEEAGVLERHLHFAGHHHGLLTNAGAIPTGRALLDELAAFIGARATDEEKS